MKQFRAYTFIWDPTMRAMLDDGAELYTLASVLDLARFTAIPAYSIATGQFAMVDEPLDWRVCGTFGAIQQWPRRILHGVHLPENIGREIAEYYETFVREHPDTPCIPRTEIAYQRNSYTTTRAVLYTYNLLKDNYNDNVRKFDSRSFTRDEGTNQRTGAASPRNRRTARNTQGSRTRNVAASHAEFTDSLFDEEGGGDRD